MSNKFRLPTKEEFERLSKCWSRFDDEKKIRYFFDEETGEKLFLPCLGDGTMDCSDGYYWSSTHSSRDGAYYFYFNSRRMDPNYKYYRCHEKCVRLVSDAPFGDAIHVAGLYWKPKNEEGYYSYDEAIGRFENK